MPKSKSRRNTKATPSADAAQTAPPPPAVALTEQQRARLLAAKSWWQEGEFALDFLAERAEHEGRLAQVRALLGDLRAEGERTPHETLALLLRLLRGLSSNRALNRRLLTPGFAGALRDLLFGADALPSRLSRFLASQRLVGAQTAAHFLYAAFPDRFALVSPVTLAVVSPTREQRAQARASVSGVYGAALESAPAQVVTLLGELALYQAARDALGVDSFVDVNAILWHGRGLSRSPVSVARPDDAAPPGRATALAVHEAAANYATATLLLPAPPEPEPDDVFENGSERDLLDLVEAHVAAHGFTFAPLAVRNYYVSLKTKPFVILAGLSGTGKTRLTELLAEAITGDLTAQYLLLPVRPDWTDPSALLGYHNLLAGEYVSTPFLDLLRAAARPQNAHRAFFVCLDEMNLARVEHYFADVLSTMETRARLLRLPGGEPPATLAPNVFLTGSVNVDEAAYPFSKKVLDRANTLEFSEVRLRGGKEETRPADAALPAPLSFRARQRLFLRARVAGVAGARERLTQIDAGYAERALDALASLNDLLEPRGLHFGYRVRDDVLMYLANSFDATTGHGLLHDEPNANFAAALDLQIVQKALPRLSGTHEALESTLAALDAWAGGQTSDFSGTRAKLVRMRRRAREEGVVTFYEP